MALACFSLKSESGDYITLHYILRPKEVTLTKAELHEKIHGLTSHRSVTKRIFWNIAGQREDAARARALRGPRPDATAAIQCADVAVRRAPAGGAAASRRRGRGC